MNLSEEVQNEVKRIREMIAETKALLPHTKMNWFIYDGVLSEAERAVREQDAVALVRILPELREM
jgi:hypothetical protein